MIISWIVHALILLLCAAVIPGVHVSGIGAAFFAVLIIGLVNMIAKPIFVLLTLPITVITLGIFLFFVNAIMFYFAGSLYSGFQVDGAWAAIFGSLIYSFVTQAILGWARPSAPSKS